MDPYAAAFGRGFGTTSLGTEDFLPEYLPLALVFRASGSLTGGSVDGRPCCALFWIHSLRSPLAANHFVVNNKLPDGSTDVALAYSTCVAVNPYFPGYRGAIHRYYPVLSGLVVFPRSWMLRNFSRLL